MQLTISCSVLEYGVNSLSDHSSGGISDRFVEVCINADFRKLEFLQMGITSPLNKQHRAKLASFPPNLG